MPAPFNSEVAQQRVTSSCERRNRYTGLRSSHWLRAAPPFGTGGVSCTGAETGAAAAGAEAACGAAGGGGGIGSGQIGSAAALAPDWPVMDDAAGLALCFLACRGEEPAEGALGFAAAAAATPGRTGPVGSGFMMLTRGIDAALGKSILTILCDGTFGCGCCVASATGASEPVAHCAA